MRNLDRLRLCSLWLVASSLALALCATLLRRQVDEVVDIALRAGAVGAAATAALGAILTWRLGRRSRQALANVRGKCLSCAYSLPSPQPKNCPECGEPTDSDHRVVVSASLNRWEATDRVLGVFGIVEAIVLGVAVAFLALAAMTLPRDPIVIVMRMGWSAAQLVCAAAALMLVFTVGGKKRIPL